VLADGGGLGFGAGLRTLARNAAMSLSVSRAESGRDVASIFAAANANSVANNKPMPASKQMPMTPGDFVENAIANAPRASSNNIQRMAFSIDSGGILP